MMRFAVIVFFAVAMCALLSVHERHKMRRFLERGCTGFRWRQRFPEASKTEIREFLDIFVGAFGYRQSWRLKFAPDDSIMQFYYIRYPLRGEPDNLELEDLAVRLEERYDVDVQKTWREDITLGDLFAQTRHPVV
jgi:propanediol dehydratase small subunit